MNYQLLFTLQHTVFHLFFFFCEAITVFKSILLCLWNNKFPANSKFDFGWMQWERIRKVICVHEIKEALQAMVFWERIGKHHSHCSVSSQMLVWQRKICCEEMMKNYRVVPFAVESFSTCSEPAKSFVNKLGPILHCKYGNVCAKSVFIQKIRFEIHGGNVVAAISGTTPQKYKINETFYLPGSFMYRNR